jgi:hypothetical protein
MAAMREGSKRANRGQDFLEQTVGCVQIIRSDVLPNFVEIQKRFRMEVARVHE